MEDFLNDLNENLALPQASITSKKLSKLVPPFVVRLRKNYKFQDNSSP